MLMSRLKLHGNEKILIVRPDRIGDLVLALPVASLLKKDYPKLSIHFLASSYNASILKYAEYVDDYILMTDSKGNPLNIGKLTGLIEIQSYDMALFIKPGWRSALAVYLAGVPLRLGTSRRFYSFLFNRRVSLSRRNSNAHEVDLNIKMLNVFGLSYPAGTINPELDKELAQWPSIAGLNAGTDYIIVHPGSKGSAPNWPESFYQELINELAKDYKVVITGQGNELSGLPDSTINLINKTDFAGLIGLISKAQLLISGGTGPLHVAAALGTPVLGLFPNRPATGPQRWGPRGKYASFLAPDKQNDHICSVNGDGSCDCMKAIEIQTVYERALKIVGQGRSDHEK